MANEAKNRARGNALYGAATLRLHGTGAGEATPGADGEVIAADECAILLDAGVQRKGPGS